jgi:DNA-binding winged helix-turn-helix (wHTH) protein
MGEILFPPFRLDVLNEKLWRGAEAVPLRPKTFAILRYLAEHPGRLVCKAELLRAIWGETQVSEDGQRDYIREIRHALHDDSASPRFVETVRGRGYRFISPITTLPQAVVSSQSARDSEERGNEQQRASASPLLTVRGIYDGKSFRALPTESVPTVSREVAVVILFLESGREE